MDGVKEIGEDMEFRVPNLQESASIDETGTMTITINNLSVSDSEPVDISFAECKPSSVTASILTQKMDAYNTFENPDTVKEEAFTAFQVTEKGISFVMPACSVIQFRVK